MARDFNGSTDDILYTNVLDPNATPFTMAIWAKADALDDPNDQHMILHQQDGTGVGRNTLGLDKSGANWFIATFLGGSSLVGTTNVPTGGWHHYALTHSTAGAGTLRLYLDGVEEASATRTPEACNGSHIVGEHKNVSRNWDGPVAELAFWNRELSAAEISILADGFAPTFLRNGLILYPPLIRDTHELASGATATVSGTTVSEHPPIIYPTQPITGFAVAAAPPALDGLARMVFLTGDI